MNKMKEPSDQNVYKLHKFCRAMFKTHLSRKTSKYGTNMEDEVQLESTEQTTECGGANESTQEDGSFSSARRFKRRSLDEKEKICFICNVKEDEDIKGYNDGGLARCSQLSAKDKLLGCMENHLKDEQKRYYEGAYRLNLLISGNAHDIFAADVYYHK